MGDSMKGAIDDLVGELNRQLKEVAETKRVINTLCRRIGEPPMFPDEDIEASGAAGRTVKRDQFFGRPLVTVVRELLEMRGALSSDEIVKGLEEGDFDFEWKNELRAKNVSISLSKNMQFIRLPSGTWGLRAKYPNAKKAAGKKKASTRVPEGATETTDVKTDAPRSASKAARTAHPGKPKRLISFDSDDAEDEE